MDFLAYRGRVVALAGMKLFATGFVYSSVKVNCQHRRLSPVWAHNRQLAGCREGVLDTGGGEYGNVGWKMR